MKRALRKIHLYYYLLLVAIFFGLLFPFLWFFSRKEKHYPHLNKVRKLTALLPSMFSGIFYKYCFKEKIDWSKSYIVCANHASSLDIFALTLLMKNNNFFFMGKEELLDSIFTRTYFKTIDVPVNRKSKMSSYRAFKSASERLEKNMSLLIFPEGKIGDEYPPLLHPFKNGPFKLAIQYNIPILPVSIINTWEHMWDDGMKLGTKAGMCEIYIHDVIETALLSEKDEENLKNNVFEIVHSTLNYNISNESENKNSALLG